jgi:hypothetical protein
MTGIFSLWFDEEATELIAYLVTYCLCVIAMWYFIDHLKVNQPQLQPSYSAATLGA